jgi:ketosteroid isomerase-like protein
MLKPALCILALLAATPAFAQRAAPHPASQIAAAERAFAADGAAMGVKASFLKWSTPDAVILGARASTVAETFAGQPDLKPEESDKLVWWPLWTGISRTNDLGFSTGPVENDGKRTGHYFTIWKKQADGSWKWIYDGGVGASSAAEAPATTTEGHLQLATVGTTTPAGAMTEVAAAEASLAAAAAVDQKAAHMAALADDARLYVAPLPPAKGRADFAATLDGYPATLALSAPMGGEASKAGDMAFDYGKADWVRDGAARTGWYVHVWQKRRVGWRLVFSQILSAPPPPAAG